VKERGGKFLKQTFYAQDIFMMHAQSENYCCAENLAADYANLASDTGEVAIICLS
jgi:hypothetical protein